MNRSTARVSSVNRHRSRQKRRGRTARRFFSTIAIVVGFAACLSGETGQYATDDSDDEAIGSTRAAITLPPGRIIDTQANSGWTEGSFSVNDNGAAEYHLPLWVPDGRGGLRPELALHYNSQAGNGLLGVGWSLSAGLSTITPCPRTLAQDGRIENPTLWQRGDAFCLDGQRLRPTDSVWSQEQDYRTERDTFARIRAYSPPADDPLPTPDYFRVWTKGGEILTYNARLRAYPLKGSNLESEDPSLRLPPNPRRVTGAWALSRIEDRNGNAITIDYDTTERPENNFSVEMVPRFITYGPDRQIELLYEDRTDDPGQPELIHGFRPGVFADDSGGTHTELSRRLSMIRVRAGEELLREYRLTYTRSFSSWRSQLLSVSECDGAVPAVCLNSLEFEWSQGSNSTFEEIDDTTLTDVARAARQGRHYIPGDINGDGKDDLLYRDPDNNWRIRFSNGSGFNPPQNAGIPRVNADYNPKASPIDFDRDGRMDVMVEVPANADRTEFALYRSTGSGYQHVFSDSFYAWTIDGEFVRGQWAAYFADIDGNGLPDYIGPRIERDPAGSEHHLNWRYRLNFGAEFGPYEDGPNTDGPIQFVGDDVPFDYQIRSFVSDGPRARLLYWDRGSEEGFELYRAMGLQDSGLVADSAVANLPFLLEPESADRRNLHFADVNGDGLDDAVYPCSGMKVQLSSGVGFSALIDGPSEWKACTGPAGTDDNLRTRVVDWNGDGNDDIILIHDGEPTGPADYEHGLQLYTWTGRRMARRATNIPTSPITSDVFNMPLGGIQPLDFNGDGLMDLAQVWRTDTINDNSRLRLLRRASDVPDKMTRVNVVGLGTRVDIDYATLADASVHTPAVEACTYPITCPRRGGSVVSRHWVANGMTTGSRLHQFTHHYEAARVDLRGHGWLGFEAHSTLDDERGGAATTAFFDNRSRSEIPLGDGVTAYVYPFAGVPHRVSRAVTSGVVNGSQVNYEHATVRAFSFRLGAIPGTWLRRLSLAFVSDRERIGSGEWTTLHSQTTTLDEFDAFENATRATTILAGWSQVDVLTYDNNTADWLIGQTKTRVATSCAPPASSSCQTRTSRFDYYPDGDLREVIVEPNDTQLRLRTAFTYDTTGNIESIASSDAAGETRTTSYGYDSLDLYPATMTNALGQTTSVTIHSGLGVLLSSQDANGIIPATMAYDRFGRLREVNGADGYFERYATVGLLARSTTTPNGTGGTITAQTAFLDELGRQTQVSTPAFGGGASLVRTTYDRLGRTATVTRPFMAFSGDPVHTTSYEYDLRDRLLSIEEPDGVTTRHEYIGRQTHTYDGRNIHSYVLEREDGRVGSRFEDDPDSANWLETSFEYGPFGLLRETIAADGTSQTIRYDNRGRRTQHIDPSTGTTTWAYNAFGELRRETDATGRQTNFQNYDLLGRPRRVDSLDGVTNYQWDRPGAIGRLDYATQQDTNGHYVITRFVYDDIGRTIRTSWQIDVNSIYRVDAGFDNVGRLASITYPQVAAVPAPARLKVNYTYDTAGYLLGATNATTGALYWRADGRAPDRQLTLETYGNGLVGTRQYYPETGLLQRLTTNGPSGQVDQISYGYDASRNVTSRNDLVGASTRSQTFTYDTLDRLQTWTHRLADESDAATTTFEYDPVGNLLSETVVGRIGRDVTYGYAESGAPPHVLTSRNGQSYAHDAAGRRIAGGALASATYNRWNLPMLMQRSGGGAFEFAYDAAGSRVLKRTNEYTLTSIAGFFERKVGTQVSNTHYIMAEGREVAQVATMQNVPSGPVTTTQVQYIHADRQGSATMATSQAGTVVSELFYDPFGRRTDQDYDPLVGPVPFRPGYTGHKHDDELDFIDMNGRVYDHETRRFLTPDPFVQAPLFSQSHNRYSYVWNNPATFTDPTGFSVWDEIVSWLNGGDSSNGKSSADLANSSAIGSVEYGLAAAFKGQQSAGMQALDRALHNLGWGWSEAPSSDDDDYTDPSASGALGGAQDAALGVGSGSVITGYTGVLGLPIYGEPVGPPEWIATMGQQVRGMLWNWANMGGAAGAGWPVYSSVVDGTVGGALALDRLAGFVPFGGTVYYAGTGQWGNAVASGLTDLALFGGARLAASGIPGGPRRPIINVNAPRTGVPASGSGITAAEQQAVNALGDAHGCWTPGCGARVPSTGPQPGRPQGNWIGDHQLPNAINPLGTPQYLVPHCLSCSRSQGSWLGRLIRWVNSR
jgi:RHS repeat-associated protein